MNVCELKQEYQKILDHGLMEYDAIRMELKELIRENEQDDRKGIQAVLTQAKKRITEIDEELDRIRGMMYFEKKYEDYQVICGVDEVGRGSLAGPIFSAAVVLPKDFIIPKLNDSKQVPKKLREEIYEIIMGNAIAVGVGSNSEKVIDEQGITFANKDAMRKAVMNLLVPADLVLIDAVDIPGIDAKQVSIVKGDAKSVSIAAASIVAKVTRDRIMADYDKQYPEYGFADNVGYGSPQHLAALKKYGPCPIHRRCFLKKILGTEL